MNALSRMLLRCRDQFQHYADNHYAKAQRLGADFPNVDQAAIDDTTRKAETNTRFAQEITDTILADPSIKHQSLVLRLKKPGSDILAKLTPDMADALHMTGGVCSEAGELFDAIKRWAIYGKELDRTNVVEELGDLEFFMEGLRQLLRISREETLEANMAKLGVRYSAGFSDQAAIDRADKA